MYTNETDDVKEEEEEEEEESPPNACEIPHYGEGEVVSVLLDMEEDAVTFFKWTDPTMEAYSFRSDRIPIRRYQREEMYVVCLVKGNAKVAIEYCPIPPSTLLPPS